MPVNPSAYRRTLAGSNNQVIKTLNHTFGTEVIRVVVKRLISLSRRFGLNSLLRLCMLESDMVLSSTLNFKNSKRKNNFKDNTYVTFFCFVLFCFLFFFVCFFLFVLLVEITFGYGGFVNFCNF